MKREYWIDKGYYKNGAWSSYEAEETYQDYRQALQEYKADKMNLQENEYIELWIVDWDDEYDEMVDYTVKFRHEGGINR